jgi:IL2-inducible T-cell kinase
MQYLHDEMHILHNDLAVRNVLVCTNDRSNENQYLCKVSDFGLSIVFEDTVINKDIPIPSKISNSTELFFVARWSAPEVCTNKRFSKYSDAWSFGVVLWEIFSDGKTPYDAIDQNSDVIKYVCRGDRLSFDGTNAPKSIQDIAKLCFHEAPTQRVLFADLTKQIQQAIKNVTLTPIVLYD